MLLKGAVIDRLLFVEIIGLEKRNFSSDFFSFLDPDGQSVINSSIPL